VGMPGARRARTGASRVGHHRSLPVASSISSLSPRADQTSRRPRLVDVRVRIWLCTLSSCERYHPQNQFTATWSPLRVASSGGSSAAIPRFRCDGSPLPGISCGFRNPSSRGWRNTPSFPGAVVESRGDSGPWRTGEQTECRDQADDGYDRRDHEDQDCSAVEAALVPMGQCPSRWGIAIDAASGWK